MLIMLGEVMLSCLLFWGIPGLCMGGLGEEVQPGEGTGSEGDFMWTGDAPAEPTIMVGDLMDAAAATADAEGPCSMPASWEGVWGDLRAPDGEPSMGDWTCLMMGDLRGLPPGECTPWPAWMLSSAGLRPMPRWLGMELGPGPWPWLGGWF